VLNFFGAYIASFRPPRWRIVRLGTRLRQLFSAQFTLGVTRVAAIKNETLRFRRLWVDLLRELASRRLWYFYHGEPADANSLAFDLPRFSLSFRRCACCRPSYLFFMRSFLRREEKINYQVRPCTRALCPFCAARCTEWQYLFVKKKVNNWLHAGENLSLVYRARQEFVAAEDFSGVVGCDPEQVHVYASTLRKTIEEHIAAYRLLVARKEFQRRSVASLWRVVVWPVENGWTVESRQFMIVQRGVRRLPFVDLPKTTAGTTRRLAVERRGAYQDFNDQFYMLFGEFCRYPRAILTGYVELTAAVLWATRDLRLLASTGAFRGALRRNAKNMPIRTTKRKAAAKTMTYTRLCGSDSVQEG